MSTRVQGALNGASDYGNMTHAQLVALRASIPADDPRQTVLAPYEHQAFAREWTQDSPIVAPLSLTFAIPAYSAAKALGVVHARSQPSIAAILDGYKGVCHGLGTVIN